MFKVVWYSNNAEEVAWGKKMVAAWNQAHPNEKVTGQEIPTGKSSEDVMGLLRRLNSEFGKTIVMVTHDAHAAAHAGTTLHLEKGVLIERQGAAV